MSLAAVAGPVGPMSDEQMCVWGRGGEEACTMKSNASWLMVTRNPVPPNRHTRVKTLPSGKSLASGNDDTGIITIVAVVIDLLCTTR